ncbi:hypothetical protein [Haloferax mucosum]|nr:hypothetical protein [Haloferax mucosum]
MPLSTRAYLSRKGTLELLCEINPAGSRFDDLVDELSISRPTLATRITEGSELSLIEQKAVSGERGTTHKHVLTPRGATLRVRMFEEGLVLSYRQYKNARKQFEENSERFTDSIFENPPNLSDEKRNQENLQTILQRSRLSHLIEDEDG